jgi:ribosome biogenesis protein UTP30
LQASFNLTKWFSSIKIGTLSHSPAQILENIKTALPAVIKKVRGGWDNVQSFNIKTNSSISLPIWTCALGDGADGRWGGGEDKKAGDDEEKAGGDEEAEPWGGIGSGDEMVVDADAGKKSKRRKKREAEGDETSPNKKAKNSTNPEKSKVRGTISTTPSKAEPQSDALRTDAQKHDEGEATPTSLPRKKKRKAKGGAAKEVSDKNVETPASASTAAANESSQTIADEEAKTTDISTKPAVVVQPDTKTPEKKMKRKDKRKLEAAAASLSAPSTPTHAVPPVPTNTPAAAAPESAPVASPSMVKKKRAKKSKLAATETPSNELSSMPAPTPAAKESTSTVTPSEVKEKRSSEGITKKKARITKGGAAGKSGKAKEELVGKKVKAKI